MLNIFNFAIEIIYEVISIDGVWMLYMNIEYCCTWILNIEYWMLNIDGVHVFMMVLFLVNFASALNNQRLFLSS